LSCSREKFIKKIHPKMWSKNFPKKYHPKTVTQNIKIQQELFDFPLQNFLVFHLKNCCGLHSNEILICPFQSRLYETIVVVPKKIKNFFNCKLKKFFSGNRRNHPPFIFPLSLVNRMVATEKLGYLNLISLVITLKKCRQKKLL